MKEKCFQEQERFAELCQLQKNKVVEPQLWERVVDASLAAEVGICDKQYIYSTLINVRCFGDKVTEARLKWFEQGLRRDG